MKSIETANETTGWRSVPSANYFALHPNPTAIILGGLGDGAGDIEASVYFLRQEGLQVAGVMPRYSDSSKIAIHTTLQRMLTEVNYSLDETADESNTTPRIIGGLSIGGGEAVLAAQLALPLNPRIYGSVVLVNSIGISNKSFGPRPLAEFNRRRKSQPQDLCPKVKNTINSIGRLVYFLDQNNYPEMIDEVLKAGHEIYVCSANNDVVFKANESDIALRGITDQRLHRVRIPGEDGHASLASAVGQRQMAYGLKLALVACVEKKHADTNV